MSASLLKSQDVLLLCKLLVRKKGAQFRQIDLARDLQVSQSEISAGMERLIESHLLDLETKLPNKMMAFEFLESSVKFMFPAKIGQHTVGVPTSIYAEPLAKKIIEKGIPLVWPSAGGKVRGIGLEPIHASAPHAVQLDPKLHELLSLVDAIRSFKPGRVKEQASHFIRKIVFGSSDD